jgi:hypothetical protein
LEEIEEQREDLLDLFSELEVEASAIFFGQALQKLILIFGNIINNPNEDKFKTIKLDNQAFHSSLGRFKQCAILLKFIGFQTMRMDNSKLAYIYKHPTGEAIPTHPLILIAYDEARTS